MRGPSPGRVLLALSLCAALAAPAVLAGGWAVITVEHLPDHAIAGEPVSLAYVVRQHGAHPLGGLTGRVTAKNGREHITAPVRADASEPRYATTLTFPTAGDWSITIESGFAGRGTLELLPLQVSARTDRAPASSPEQRGRQLFVAKGCAACHRVDGTDLPGGLLQGPPLVPRRYRAEYLAQILANPTLIPRSPAYGFRMPNLSLKEHEIAALIAFINDRQSHTTAHGRQ